MKFSLLFLIIVLLFGLQVIAGDQYLNKTTVRASTCISNSTHCHCALHTASENSICIKPTESDATQCKKGKCAAGYHCDCEASDICEKVSTVFYKADGDSSTDEFPCSQGQASTPRRIVGKTTDFHIVVHQGFQLFVNAEQVGYSTSTDYKVFTAEIQSGDVVAVIAKREAAETFGVKLRFQDLQNETRYIDENWYSSATYISSWLATSFDPVGQNWSHPSIATTLSSPSFDVNVPWMWHNSSDTVYFRYVLP